MTDKELNQIDFWLSGQKRYKLLDCSRRGFLKLKGARLQVWLAHYTSERDSQQSWLSLEWLMADTGCSKPTVIAARRWLVKHGWIRVLEGSAADMYENPTQGAHKVRIMCVDDPTNGVGGKESLLGEGVKKLDVKELGKETLPNVSVSAFAFASASAVASGIEVTTTHATTCMSVSPSEEDEKQKPKQQQQPPRSSSATKWLLTYDSPMPEEFKSWSQESRTTWCLEHKRKVLPVESKPEVLAPAQVKVSVAATAPKASVLSATPTPPTTPPPPARWNCRVCEFDHKHASGVAEHIEKKHPELGQQSFRIDCPKCNWGMWWNKLDDNKAVKEAELLDHLEVEHNPTSPRYAPYKYP